MSTINFTCPHCSHTMEFPAAVEGKQGKCPSCNIVVTVENNSLVDLASLQQQPIPKQPEPSPTGPVQQQSNVKQLAATKDVPLKMGTTTFAKKNLRAGETIIHAGRFHPILVRMTHLLLLVGVVVIYFLIMQLSEHPSFLNYQWIIELFRWKLFGVFHIAALVGWVGFLPFWWVLYKWGRNVVYKTEFVLTNKRLIAKWGFLRTATREIQLEKIESVDYGQIFLERWLGIGRLTVRGTGGGKVGKFKFLLDALEFRHRFLDQIDRVKT